jgi:hypothetical protein
MHEELALPMALPKVAPCHRHALFVRHGLQQQGQLFVHGTHQTYRGKVMAHRTLQNTPWHHRDCGGVERTD